MRNNFLFTSESVTMGHPDKVADLISDSILDYIIDKDANAHVACETLVSSHDIIIAGEVKSTVGIIPVNQIVQDALHYIGYDDIRYGFDLNNCIIHNLIKEQSPEINLAVSSNEDTGAGDQGMMFGYACNESKELMPLPISLAHKLCKQLSDLRKSNSIPWLAPDAKAQVTIKYDDNNPVSVERIVISTQHLASISLDELQIIVKKEVIDKVIPKSLIHKDTLVFINPSGSFISGGMMADTGLTGRKIIVDTYGGSCPHGGGAFSGKDATKVDRSAAYMARYIAKNIVAAQLADKCTIQLSYAIGVSEPISLNVNLHYSGKVDEEKLLDAIKEIFPLTPRGIIDILDLKRPINSLTTNYGHFGRELPEFLWEKTDKFSELKSYFNL